VVLSISINITGNVIMSPTLYSYIDQHSPYLKSSLPSSVFFFFFFPCCCFFFSSQGHKHVPGFKLGYKYRETTVNFCL